MALIIPATGQQLLLARLLNPGAGENLSLKLYQTVVLGHLTTAATLDADQPVAMVGYIAKTLLPANWGAPTDTGSAASSTYTGPAQTWTNGGPGPFTIKGYYLTGSTSGTLYWAEDFSPIRTLNVNDVLNLTPKFTLT